MRKFLIMAIACIAGFQQASADVCKLKVKTGVKKVLESYDEVWVHVHSGDVLYKAGGMYRSDCSNKSPLSLSSCVHIVKSSVNNFVGGVVKKEYEDAIFCSNEQGKEDEVVINVNGAGNKQAEAKRQFENIIKCGLLNGDSFNGQIYDHPFNGVGWRMPGISAFVKDGKNAANVYCAMKTNCPGSNSHLWNVGEYTGINATSDFHNYEHTERQLIVNHLTDGDVANASRFNVGGAVLVNANTRLRNELLTDGNLFVWTKGNPCTSASGDNGYNCCTKWYSDISDIFQHVDVYFSLFAKNSVALNEFRTEIINWIKGQHNDVQETTISTLLNKLKYNTSELNIKRRKYPINGVWEYILNHERIKTLRIILDAKIDNLLNNSTTFLSFVRGISGVCDALDAEKKHQIIEREFINEGFQKTRKNQKIDFFYK